MSICLVKQNDGTWAEKHKRFLFNVYKRFFLFLSRFFTFFNVFYFFSETFFYIYAFARVCIEDEETRRSHFFIFLTIALYLGIFSTDLVID